MSFLAKLSRKKSSDATQKSHPSSGVINYAPENPTKRRDISFPVTAAEDYIGQPPDIPPPPAPLNTPTTPSSLSRNATVKHAPAPKQVNATSLTRSPTIAFPPPPSTRPPSDTLKKSASKDSAVGIASDEDKAHLSKAKSTESFTGPVSGGSVSFKPTKPAPESELSQLKRLIIGDFGLENHLNGKSVVSATCLLLRRLKYELDEKTNSLELQKRKLAMAKESNHSESAGNQEAVEKQKMEIQNLRRELETVNLKLKSTKSVVSSQNEIIAKLKAPSADKNKISAVEESLKKTILEKDKEISLLKTKLEQQEKKGDGNEKYQKQIDILTNSLEKEKKVVTDLLHKEEQLRIQYDKLKKEASYFEGKISKLMDENKMLNSNVEKLNFSVKQKEEELKDAKTEASKVSSTMNNELELLRLELSSARKNEDSVLKEIEEVKKEIQNKAEQEQKEIGKQLKLVEENYKNVSIELTASKKQVKDMESEISVLKKQLSEAKAVRINSSSASVKSNHSSVTSIGSSTIRADSDSNEESPNGPSFAPPPPPVQTTASGFAAPAPPPPPPPPPPQSLVSSTSVPIPAATENRSNLLAEIQGGKKLKSVEVAAESSASNSPPPQSDPMAMMMAEMQKKKLKHAEVKKAHGSSSEAPVDKELLQKLHKRKN